MVKQPFFICKDLVHHPIESTVYKWMFRVPAKIHIINKDGSIKHGILYDIWSMQNYRIQKHRICSEYIYICLHLRQTPIRIDKGSRPCSMHVSAKWCFLAKGVTSSLSPRAQNDSDDIRSSKSENSQPRIALPMAHLSLACSSIDQVFTKWIIKWITDPLKLPQQTTTKKKNTLWVASRWSFLDLGVCWPPGYKLLVPWFHGVPWWNGLAKMLDLATRSTYWPFNLAAPGAFKTWQGKTLRDWWELIPYFQGTI